MRVAVIGGGWAGIAAAVELTAAGTETTLFEAGRACLLYTSPSPRDRTRYRMPSSA